MTQTSGGRSKDLLRNLIASLSKGEKRAFKLLSKVQSGDKSYLRVFDMLERGAATSELDTLNLKNLPFIKHYLQEQLLELLRTLHASETVSTELASRSMEIELLIERKQYTLAAKILAKAEKLASDGEEYLHLLNLLRLERELINKEDAAADARSLTELREERIAAQNEFDSINRLQDIYDDLYNELMTNGPAMTDAMKGTFESIHSQVSNVQAPRSLKGRLIRELIEIRYHQALRDPSTSAGHTLRAIELCEAEPVKVRYQHKLYKFVIALHSFNLVDAGKYDEALRYCREFRALCSDDPSDPYFSLLVLVEFNLLMHTRQLHELLALRSALHQLLGRPQKRMIEATLHYNLARMAFVNGEFDVALKHLDIILALSKHDELKSLIAHARGMHLLLHFQLENTEYLKYALRAYKQYLKRTGQLVPFTEAMISFLGRSKRPDTRAYEQLQRELEAITFARSEEKVMDWSDVRIWLTSKVEGISMPEAFKRIN